MPNLPTEATAGAWVNQAQVERGRGLSETARAEAITNIGDTCERWQHVAERRTRPWYRRIF